MAKRRTIHILKNNQTNNGALPTSGVQMGEPLVNLYNGILFFSGTPAGNYVQSNNNTGYFEVGSNLYNLDLRNQITRYQNISGSGLDGKFLSGTTTGFVLANISSIVGADTFVTGATWTPNVLTLSFTQGKSDVPVTISSFSNLALYGTTNVNGNIVVTGNTNLNGNLIVTGNTNMNGNLNVTGNTNLNGTSFYNQTVSGVNPFEIVNYGSLTSHTQSTEIYVTGFTYDNANTLTISRNQGLPNLTTNISTLASITVNGDVIVTGTTTTGNLIVNNPLGTPATVGQGGLIVGSGGSFSSVGIGDVVIHGNLTVFGTGTTVATNELYVEDPQITLNYNPTGNTASTSIASGLRIQDGDGVDNDVFFTIAQMNTFTGGDITEYTGSTGYSNRAFVTQLNDIVIRNTNLNNGAPDGFRVLVEFDILDGGTY